VGNAALFPDPGSSEMALPGLRPGISSAVPRYFEVAEGDGTVPSHDLLPPLGWDQRRRLGQREGLASATIERWFHSAIGKWISPLWLSFNRQRVSQKALSGFVMDLFQLTRALIDIDSVTPNEEKVGQFLFDHLAEITARTGGRVVRIQVQPHRYNVLAHWGEHIVATLSTHMDPCRRSSPRAKTTTSSGAVECATQKALSRP